MLTCYTITQDASFLEGAKLPDFVKLANLAPHKASKSFPDSHFGLILMDKEGSHRLYPIYDKASTWLSAEYLSKNWDGMPKTAATIAARSVCGAAELYDIDVSRQLKKLAGLAPATVGRHYWPTPGEPIITSEPDHTKTASASDASITVNGEVRPIRNPTELSRAEEWFQRNHTKIGQAEKYAMARFIVRRRSELATPGEKTAFTISVSPAATETARLDTFNPKFRYNMLKRAAVCLDSDVCQAYATLALNDKIATVSGPMAIIDQVERLDATGAMKHMYGTHLPDAISACLVHGKTAEEVNTESVKTASVKPPKSMMFKYAEMPAEFVQNAILNGRTSKVLGRAVAEKVAADLDNLFPRLPDGVQDMILADASKLRGGR